LLLAGCSLKKTSNQQPGSNHGFFLPSLPDPEFCRPGPPSAGQENTPDLLEMREKP
jgi:hypothetical protein